MKKSKILIVEDEPHLNRLIEMLLISGGYYNIQKAFDGVKALEMVNSDCPDLILLDVMLPEMDGFTFCRKLKNDIRFKHIPVIMITARKLEEDILKGFECGAVDYVVKPFNNKILLARIEANLSRYDEKVIKYEGLELDNISRTVYLDGVEVKLTNFEFELMQLFIKNIDRVFSRSQLLAYLRGDDGFEVSERAVDVQILNLRRKLGDLGKKLETVRGIGYKLKVL